MSRMKFYAPIVLRVALSLVLIWFGSNQLLDSESWLGYLPSWVDGLPVSGIAFVKLNGAAELILGLLLLAGLFVRWAALLLVLHLLGIALSLGYNDIMIRDLGLTFAMLSVFLHGPDAWSLDGKAAKLRESSVGKLLYLFDRE